MIVSADWWIPSSPERRIRGVLTESNERFELTLEGELTDLEERFDVLPSEICGESYTGGLYTLLNARRRPSVAHWSAGRRVSEGRYAADIYLEGQALERPQDAPIQAASFSHDRLYDWLRLTSLTREYPQGFGGDEFLLRHATPNLLTFEAGNLTVEIRTRLAEQSSLAPKLTSLQERHVFALLFSEPLSLGAVHDTCVDELARFLSFASGVWIRPEPLHLRFADGFGRANRAGESFGKMQFADRPGAFAEHDAHFARSLLDPQQLGNRLGPMLLEWLALSTKAPFLLNLLLSVSFAEGMFLEHRFLSLAQGLESFHRWKFGGTHIEEQDWNPLSTDIQELIAQRVPIGNAATALKNKLKYLNQITLGERLRELVSNAGGAPLNLVHDTNLFVKRVRDTRNYLTHYGDISSNTLQPGAPMAGACDQMRCLLETCVLMELGLSLAEIATSTHQNERFNDVRRAFPKSPGVS